MVILSSPGRENDDLFHYHQRVQRKNLTSMALYIASVPLAFADVRISSLIFVYVALSYFLPERKLADAPSPPAHP